MLKNRWSYTSRLEKRQFYSTVFIISSVVLLELILIDIISGAFYGRISYYFDLLFGDYFTGLRAEELGMIKSNLVLTLTAWLSFGITCGMLILFLRRSKTKYDLNINNRVSVRFKMPENWLVLMLFGLAIVYMFGVFSAVFDLILGSMGIEKIIYEELPFPGTAFGVIIYFAALVISPAILEEFFCRYLILNALRKYGDGFAMIVSSVFFGLLHGRTSAFFFATAVGFFLAYFAIKTKSIWFPVILHAFINFMAFFWHFISDLTQSDRLYELISFSFWTVLFGVSAVYIISVIRKRQDLGLEKRRDYIHISRGRKIFVFFNAATIIFIILAFMHSAGEYYMPGVYW